MLTPMRRRLASRLAPFAVVCVMLASLSPLAGCATFESDLQRSEDHFQHDEHEKALANLRALENDWTSFSVRDQARYCYLRGMTDLRLGFISDARHWLAVAQQIDKEHPGALLDKERRAMDDKLAGLNEVIWNGDVLPIDEPPGDRRSKKVQTTTSDADKDGKGDEAEEKAKPKKPEEGETAKPKKKKPKLEDDDDRAPPSNRKKGAEDE
jgi:hypothetical protein